MRRRASLGLAIGCAGLMLAAAGGCTVSIQPWSKPTPPGPPGLDSVAPGIVPAGFQAPMPKPVPGAAQPGNNNEIFVQLNKQLNEAEDQRKALLEQVQTLKKQVREREDHLRLASHEMEESSSRLKHTRDEFREWEAEMQELRDRVRKLEDNRKAVAQLIEEILNHLDRPREPLRLPKSGALDK